MPFKQPLTMQQRHRWLTSTSTGVRSPEPALRFSHRSHRPANGSRNTTINHVKCSRQHGGRVHGTSIADKHITYGAVKWAAGAGRCSCSCPCYTYSTYIVSYNTPVPDRALTIAYTVFTTCVVTYGQFQPGPRNA